MRTFPLIAAAAFGALMTLAVASPPARAATVQEVTSPGGLKAWLVEDYTVPIVAMNVAFRGGAAQDPPGKAGLANLMSGLLDEGAADLDSRGFQAKLEDLSIELSFDGGPDAFYGNLRTLSTNLDQAFDLFRIAVTAPRFDAEPVERIRGQIIAGLRQDETSPNDIAQRLFSQTLFGDHPYGSPQEGTVESVATISADDLRAFHARTMARDNLYVVFVGAIDAKAAGAALDKMFGALPEHATLNPIAETVPALDENAHAALSVPQSAIRIGGPGLKRDDPDFITAYVANEILGGGTFSSRLYKAVREDRGLAYSVGSSLLPYDHAGAFVAATSVDATKTAETVEIMRQEIARYASEGPTATELAATKDYLVGNFALRFDSSQKIARNLLSFQLDGLGIDYIERRNDLIRAVTLADIKRVAQAPLGRPALGRDCGAGPGLTPAFSRKPKHKQGLALGASSAPRCWKRGISGLEGIMKFKAAPLSALLIAWSASFAAAGPAVDAATRAEALVVEGKTAEALDALAAAMDAICEASPLAFRKVAVVDSSGGYGVYSERADKTFKPDEKMMVYVEPICFGYGGSGAATTIGFTADLAIENTTGQVLGEAKDVFSLSTPSTPGKREFSMTLSFGVPFLRPGDYKAIFTVRDQNSDKSGTFEVPFTITLPTAG